jgi:hypothetical protein
MLFHALFFITLNCLIVNCRGVSTAPCVPRVPVERFQAKEAKIKRIESVSHVRLKIYYIHSTHHSAFVQI